MEQNIDSYLEKLNWKFERVNETTIVSGFKGEDSTFTFYIFSDQDWIIFSIFPNLKVVTSEKISEITHLLTRMNFDTTLVKFSLDEKANVIISIELPICTLSETVVEIALDAICSKANDLYKHLPELQT